jgi:exopolyphosphatase/guanosine-5'-triphosphate,3'-diphosphate pyrophosphatase
VRSAGAVAAIDCGTNSTRLLVLDGAGGRLDRRMRITRLGEGVDENGVLSAAALERTFAAMREFREVLDVHGVRPGRVRAAATSATRDAGNREEFLAGAESILGCRPEVIEGTEEGRLSFVGATGALPPGWADEDQAVLVVDIGGGSTELIVGVPAVGKPTAVESMDIGCVRTTERYLRSDPPAGEELATARAAARSLVAGVLEREPAFGTATRCVGLAGTVSALTVLALGLDGYEESKVHHGRLTLNAIEGLLGELAALPLEQRRALRGMEVGRADVLVGGAVVLAEVLAVLGLSELLASEADILDGIALELLGA